nr:dihydroorotase [Gammaproteobacteria bacterium]
MVVDQLLITRPDDWHVHLRDGVALRHTVRETAQCFARALVMPNLDPPVVTTEQALAYRQRILAAIPAGSAFQPLMTLYLTEESSPEEMQTAKASGAIHGVKLYPAGVTTHSSAGICNLERIYRVLEALEAHDLPLLIHAEVADPQVDVFDREQIFIERQLLPLVERFAGLRIVVEHVTTTEAIDFVRDAPMRVAATITAHHLLMNRNALLQGGIQPHHFCAPILQRERHRRALIRAAISGSPKFFLGTDSAPHPKASKECACASAGIYTAPIALGLYAEVFEAVGALDRLEAFSSHYGAYFYGLPRNSDTLCLQRTPTAVPSELDLGDDVVVPLRAGGTVAWTVMAS